MTEITRKIRAIRERMKPARADAVRLKGVDWFAWITGGADSALLVGAETGVAEVLVTMERALILTNSIDRERLAVEELPSEFEIVSFAWTQETGAEDFIASEFKPGLIVSDRPQGVEIGVPEEWKQLRLTLSTRELARYQELGSDTARAVSRVLRDARPEQSENELAGEIARALLERGIEPALLLVAGDGRVQRYRRPRPTEGRIGDRVMASVAGRRQGLYANLTRHVFFRPPLLEEIERAEAVLNLEAEAFRATEELRPLPDIYRRLRARYVELGLGADVDRAHYGGPTGYRAREELARPQGSLGVRVEPQMAFAWNPSLPGMRIEDTVFLGADQQLINLTYDAEWPSVDVDGRKRPALLVRS